MIRVLYVDDQPDLLYICKTFLEMKGALVVDTAGSASDALDILTEQPYDVIISDYQMPGMDGISLLVEVRKRFGGIPFIIFTGKGREEIVIEAINNGADFYLQKGGDPVSQFADLENKVRQAFRRARAEHALRQSQKTLEDIIDFLPDPTFAIDHEGRVISWNRAIQSLFGIPAKSVIGRDHRSLTIPFYHEQRPMLIDLIAAGTDLTEMGYPDIVVREGDALSADIVVGLPDGAKKYFRGKASLLYDQHGQVAGAIETIRDITSTREAEAELVRKNNELVAANQHLSTVLGNLRRTMGDLVKKDGDLRASGEWSRVLFRESPTALLVADETGAVISANGSAEELMGPPGESLTGSSVTAFVHIEDAPVLEGLIKRCLLSPGKVFSRRLRTCRRDGRTSRTRWQGRGKPGTGSRPCVLLSCQDRSRPGPGLGREVSRGPETGTRPGITVSPGAFRYTPDQGGGDDRADE